MPEGRKQKLPYYATMLFRHEEYRAGSMQYFRIPGDKHILPLFWNSKGEQDGVFSPLFTLDRILNVDV